MIVLIILQSEKLGIEIWSGFMGIWQTSYENEWNTKGKEIARE